MYDFNRCKLCGHDDAVPTYRLKDSTVYVCRGCGFHYIDHLDEMPVETGGHGVTLLDQKSRNYIENRLVSNGRQQRLNLALVKKYCRLQEADCLDIGAGAALFANYLKEEGGKVQGIEPQKIFREFALSRFGIPLHRETVDGELWQKDHADFFQIVTMWDVLEHVNFPAETVRDAFTVTRPGGWLFLDTPCRDALFYRMSEWAYRISNGSKARLLSSLYSSKPFHHKQMFTSDQLVQLVKSAGYAVVSKQNPFIRVQNKVVLVCRKPSGACRTSE